MDLRNSFTVTGDVEDVWAYLLEVENLAPCMPGAELLETVDDRNWRGRLKIKFGPVALAFEGQIEMVERDDVNRRLKLHGAGKDGRGRGAATTDVDVVVVPGEQPGTTTVEIVQDMSVSGQIAQFGRGMIADVSKQMTKQFATRLEAALQQADRAADVPAGGAADGGVAGAEPAGPGAALRDTGAAAAGQGAVATAEVPVPAAAPVTRRSTKEDDAISGFRIVGIVLAGIGRRLARLLTGRRGSETA